MRAKADRPESADLPADESLPAGAPDSAAEVVDAVGEVTPAQEARAGKDPTPEARARHAALAAELDEHQYRYYVLDQPTASDAEYDTSMRELTRLEEEFPALRTPDSPTQRVGGGDYTNMFASISHAEPMLSLGNVFSEEDLAAWAVRVERACHGDIDLHRIYIVTTQCGAGVEARQRRRCGEPEEPAGASVGARPRRVACRPA